MHIRNYILYFLLLSFSVSLSAQTFITLDWKNPSPIYEGNTKVETDMPGFSGAFYLPDTYLPCYTQQIDLGWDYKDFNYDIKIEYPVFSTLTKKEIVALDKTGYQFNTFPQATFEISESAKKGIINVRLIPIVYKDGTYRQLYSFKLNLIKAEKPRPLHAVMTRAQSDSKYADNSVLSSGKWVKIKVTDTGIYQITNSELSKMGFSNPAKVRLYGYGGNILPEDLSKTLIDDLQEVPLWREANYVLFYGKGTIKWERSDSRYIHTQNHYATYGCYFLTQSDDAPLEFPKENSLDESGATTVTTFPDYALYEKEEASWLEGGRKLFDGYDYKNGATKSYTFNLPGITNDNAIVKVAFSAYSQDASTNVSVFINGAEQAGKINISSSSDYIFTQISDREYPWTGDKTEKNTITITHNRESNVSGRLDYIRLNYTRKLALYNSYTLFRDSLKGKNKLVIDNANENTCVWNITNDASYKQIVGQLSNGKYSFVADNINNNEYVVLNPKGSFSKVEVVGTIANQNLHQLRGIDMIIITPPNSGYIAQAERLAEFHRQNDTLSVNIVTSEQIYNEFSSGTPDGTAYRRFMKMLYDRATSEKELPKYLLLFGDGSFDNRMLTTAWRNFDKNNFLLTFVSENSSSDTQSYVLDDYYGFLADGKGKNIPTDKVDIGVGRFPVRSSVQAKEVVDKLIAYMENKYAGPWKNTMCFLGDDGKNKEGNVHMRQADEAACLVEKLNHSFLVKRVYWDAYKLEVTPTGNRYPSVHKKILELMNDGLLVLNYTGHGGPSALSDELVMVSEDFANARSPKAPLLVTAACDVTPYDRIETSLGEYAFLNPKGGAIAVYSTTRTVYSPENSLMNKMLMEKLMTKAAGKNPRLGDVVRATKAGMAPSGYVNSLHFCFLGDPAMKLSYPETKVVIDKFNNQLVDGNETAQIKAGDLVTVEGRVLNENGETDIRFNGTVHPTVLDNKENVTTYNNNGDASSPFKYVDRTKTLFSGSDSIKAGTFKFTFPVPLDINYSDESGLVNLYAVTNDKKYEGQGSFENFLIGGTADNAMGTDSLGPKINLYLNTPDFVYGGKVNETPYLVAELEDEDGINTVGNGIGHDLVAIIDGSPVYTYTLNNYYQSDLGDYTKGTVRYSFSELPEGKHQLMFRAWDIKNNSSSVVLDFEVVKGLKPGLFDLNCTKSPAKENTTFILTHDRPESELDIRIEVYDFAGRTLWTHQESGVSSDNYYYVDWDLTTSSGGRVSPGIYLFRASVSAGDSKESTKARKIVVLAQ